mmetsp:Transcript_30763/g.42610  ORF Transcript_30763/g.42610 Transcript_30763/m.42610 type:complete len:146 (+) Transcript_30763:97-534(+)
MKEMHISFTMSTFVKFSMFSYVFFLASTREISLKTEAKECSSSPPNVLVTYYTESNKTKELAGMVVAGAQAEQWSQWGAQASQGKVLLLPIHEVEFQTHVVEWADAVLLGSPAHYGNVAGPLLEQVQRTWDWNADLTHKIYHCWW